MNKNGLKALLLTDWYTMRAVCICVIVAIVFNCGGISLSSAADKGSVSTLFNLFSSAFGVMLLSMSFATDEYKNMGVMKKSMPYTDRQIVLARYIPPAIIAAASAALAIIGSLIGGCIHGSFAESFAEDLAFSISLTTIYTLAMPTIFYPFFFTVGYRKAQYAFSIVSSLMMISALPLLILHTISDESADVIKAIDEFFSAPVPISIILTAAMAGLYYVSYRIAVKKFAESDV